MDKSGLIAGLLSSLSQRFSEVRSEAEHDAYRHEGAHRALLKAAGSIVALSKLVDDDIEKGRYDLDVAQRLKNYILRGSQMLMDQAQHEQRLHFVAQGRAQSVVDLVDIARKRQVEEERKQAAREVTPESGEPDGAPAARRASGVHPGPSMKAQRLAEEGHTLPPLSQSSQEAVASLRENIHVRIAEEANKPRRRGRPKKGSNGTHS